MDLKDNTRFINIVVCTVGILCCIASGFISAPEGLLDNDSTNLISVMPTQLLIVLYIIPSLLALAVGVLIIIGKYDLPSVAAMVCGGVLFGFMDFRLITEHQMFMGVLINIIGIILVATSVSLQVLATETGPAKLSRRAAKKRNAADVPYERRHRPSYDDIYVDNSSDFAVVKQTSKEKPTEVIDTETEDEDILNRLRMYMSESREENEGDSVYINEISPEEDLTDLLADIESTEEKKKSESTYEADISGILISLIESDNQTKPAEDTARANMAAALETPNQVMSDFYDGIEEIFLND